MEPSEGFVPADDNAGTPSEGEEGQAGSRGVDYEALAKEKGWNPDYEGEGKIGAEEFVKRQPLFDKIKTQSKKLKELERTVEALAKHYNESITQAKTRMLDELKAERREAIELGEVAKVEAIDARMQDISRTPEAPKVAPVLDPAIEQFVSDQREWFNKDEEMTDFAVSFNEAYLKRHPGDMEKSLEETLKAVKKAFPDKFANQRRSAPSPVEGTSPAGKGGDKYSMNRLNAEQKLVYNQLVKTYKQMTHEEYFKSLEEAGYLD